MDLKFKITEDIQLAPDPRFTALSDKQKHKLVDDIMAKPEDSRGLYVTLGLSNSGKVTNSRIYPPNHVRDSITSWTTPYQKPMLKNHDQETEPLGRINGVVWRSLDSEGIAFLKSATRYSELLGALNAGDAKRTYKLMDSYGLLANEGWEGVGKLSARVKVNDKDAIEKFLDGRYQTFSWSATTAGFTCMLCGAQWHKGNVCEHEIGKISDEGKRAIFMTGPLEGREVSVVNVPANNYSTIESMSLVDAENEESAKPIIDKLARGPIEVVLSDSRFEWDPTIKVDMTAHLATIAADALVNSLGSEHFDIPVDDFLESIAKDEHAIQWLTDVHTNLHTRFATKDLAVSDALILAVKLNKVLADRLGDASVHGDLDLYDANGLLPVEPVAEVVESEEAPVEDSKPLVINWYLLDLAFKGLLPESAKLTAEQLISLDEKVFCQDKFMPLATHEHYLTAQALMTDYQGEDKAAILAIIDTVAKATGADRHIEPCKKCSDYAQLMADHAHLLKSNEKLMADYSNVLEYFSKEAGLTFEASDKSKLEILTDWFATIPSQEEVPATTLKPVENPIAEVDASDNFKNLSGFEKQVADSYRKILDTKGKSAADMYLLKNKRYLPSDFKIN